MNRAHIALAAAIAIAISMPAILLTARPIRPSNGRRIERGPIVPSPTGAIDNALQRGLFSTRDMAAPVAPGPDDGSDQGSPDVPIVIGVVGRLPDRAVALVRRSSGGTRTLAIGEKIDGWQLSSIAADAVLFVRGERRERVEIMIDRPPTSDQ